MRTDVRRPLVEETGLADHDLTLGQRAGAQFVDRQVRRSSTHCRISASSWVSVDFTRPVATRGSDATEPVVRAQIQIFRTQLCRPRRACAPSIVCKSRKESSRRRSPTAAWTQRAANSPPGPTRSRSRLRISRGPPRRSTFIRDTRNRSSCLLSVPDPPETTMPRSRRRPAAPPLRRGSPEAAKDAFAFRQTLAPLWPTPFQVELTAAKWGPRRPTCASSLWPRPPPPEPRRSISGARRRSGRPMALQRTAIHPINPNGTTHTWCAQQRCGRSPPFGFPCPTAQVCPCRRDSPATVRTVPSCRVGNR
jgi:hypothetical protein